MTEPHVDTRPLCLVTRPAHQNQNLKEMLSQAGFSSIAFPTIAIETSSPTPFLKNLSTQLASFDMALFVSRNAVDCAFHFMSPTDLQKSLQLGVIGKGTWQALQDHGVASHVIPTDSFNSEGLLASSALQQVSGSKIIIFRGQEGRNLLGDTLQLRGAEVQYCEVYRRSVPSYTVDYFAQLTEQQFPDMAIFTSAEGLKNCWQILSAQQQAKMLSIPWLLISERMRETAADLGHNETNIIAKSASDEGILQALQEWQKQY